MPSLAQILAIGQAIFALYANPQVIANPQLKAVVDSMATQEIALMQEALSLPPETALGSSSTSTITINDASNMVQVVVNPPQQQVQQIQPIQQPSPVQNLGTVGPIEIPWKDARVQVSVGLNGVDYPWNINQSSTIFNVYAFDGSVYNYPIVSATLTIGGQTYAGNLRPDINPHEVEFAVPVLTVGGGSAGNGLVYPYSIQINASGTYTTYSDSVAMP